MVKLTPLTPLYILESRPPSMVPAPCVYAASAVGEVKLPCVAAAMAACKTKSVGTGDQSGLLLLMEDPDTVQNTIVRYEVLQTRTVIMRAVQLNEPLLSKSIKIAPDAAPRKKNIRSH